MASMERFEELLGEADEAAAKAIEMIPNTNGSERGKLYAGIAAMWLEAARLEHDLVVAESLKRQVASWGRRVDALEKKIGMERDMPDPFAESPSSGRFVDLDDEDDYDAAGGI